ncbi:IS256 family transposase [Candidatus Uhrbacteria bacterium]|nr:IS256 family transposase [Candidatus Uhrbacteria bacterium]
MKGIKSVEDAHAFIREMMGSTLQTVLEAELTDHLGYDKHDNEGDGSGNSRNGYSEKTVETSLGKTVLAVPRDREGMFEPRIIPKHGRKTTNELEDKIIAMYAQGMTTRDIHAHMQDIYGVDVSATMVSTITDKLEPQIREWRERPLETMYPIVYLDGIRFKVRDNGKMMNKCAYSVLALNIEGKKEVLGLWVAQSEGAKFWMEVLNELKNRGVEDILICCVDGLTGFNEAIEAVFPQTNIQRCIVHLIRSSLKFIPHKLKDKFCHDLKQIYTAPTEEAGLQALMDMKEAWKDHPAALQAWEQFWPDLSTFFIFSQPVRRIIYTTNAVESLHRQLRKITKTTSTFPHDEDLIKLLYLGVWNISKRWTAPITRWSEILAQLTIQFPNRINFS